MSNVYASLVDLKESLGIEDSNSKWDNTLNRALTSAARAIDSETGWLAHGFWIDPTVTVRTYDTDGLYTVTIPEGIASTTGLIVQADSDLTGTFETTLTLNTHFYLTPRNAALNTTAWPYTTINLFKDNTPIIFPWPFNGRAAVQVTALFGWPAVPDDVEEACLFQARLIFGGKDEKFGVVVAGDGGVAMRMRQGLHPIAAGLVAPYRKPAVG